MKMGQVWLSADCDGTNEEGYHGGRGSVLAVTAQNPGADRTWGTADDVLAPLNSDPAEVTVDASFDATADSLNDRVRGFNSFHPQGAAFAYGDGSVHFLPDTIDGKIYRDLSTIRGGEVIGSYQ